MKTTDRTLIEQMRITEFEIANRMQLFSISDEDIATLKRVKPHVELAIDALVNNFYELQTAIPEIALLIGDSDTLGRLHSAQRRYVLDLFSGYYDIEYVNNRLRIGMVHKRIGVEPRLYLSAIQTLRSLLFELIRKVFPDENEQLRVTAAIQKLMMFDISLVFDTYIRSLLSEIEVSREKSEEYARVLEEKVKERTVQLETLSRTDPLTGLLNVRHLHELLTQLLRASQRRNEPLTVAYLDVNDFKKINDLHGHQRGDEILQLVAAAIKSASRLEDHCFRYGGDEFCVCMANCTLSEAKKTWEERLQHYLHEHDGSLTVSIGYAQTGPDDYLSVDQLIRKADEQMYVVKKVQKSGDAGVKEAGGTEHR